MSDKRESNHQALGLASKIAATYMLLALFWIYASDRILYSVVNDPELLTLWQTYKGWLFVFLSALLLFVLIWHSYRLRIQDHLSLQEHSQRLLEHQRLLHGNEKKYRLLIESTDAIAWEYDIYKDRWTYLSPQVERVLGYESEEWDGFGF